MPRSGPRTLYKYSDEFKLTAVRLSHQPGMQVKTVAAALAIHPFMLSKWRKDVRDGAIQGRTGSGRAPVSHCFRLRHWSSRETRSSHQAAHYGGPTNRRVPALARLQRRLERRGGSRSGTGRPDL